MTTKDRYESLKKHLAQESPILLDILQKYETLDDMGYKTGFLQEDDSYTGNISWWPIISMLGTFSAGKSTFINNYIGAKVQDSGNQAVDDKFTAVCYGHNEKVTTLPGIALNADPRFPFYGISDEVDKIELGEGDRINMYMQLKTVNSDTTRGKVLIDSPGFDADSQRDTILRMTKHIIDISDLVLIFFDARHPEPGAMRDTLEHLVNTTMKHTDADKVLYILNQIDTTAKEDNLEDVISSWQRSLAQKGLITGSFYTIYNEESADVFADEAVHQRLKQKKDAHLEKILNRIDEVSIERSYRIASMLSDIAKEYKNKKFPKLREALDSWSKKVIVSDIVVLVITLASLGYAQFTYNLIPSDIVVMGGVGLLVASVLVYIHFVLRKIMAKKVMKNYSDDEGLVRAIKISTKWLKPLFLHKLKSWNKKNLKVLDDLVKHSKLTISKLNDQFITAK